MCSSPDICVIESRTKRWAEYVELIFVLRKLVYLVPVSELGLKGRTNAGNSGNNSYVSTEMRVQCDVEGEVFESWCDSNYWCDRRSGTSSEHVVLAF